MNNVEKQVRAETGEDLIRDLRRIAEGAGSIDLPFVRYVLDEIVRRFELAKRAGALAGLSSFLKDGEVVQLLDVVVYGDSGDADKRLETDETG